MKFLLLFVYTLLLNILVILMLLILRLSNVVLIILDALFTLLLLSILLYPCIIKSLDKWGKDYGNAIAAITRKLISIFLLFLEITNLTYLIFSCYSIVI